MSEDQILEKLGDVETLAGTMYAEAAGDWKEGNSSVEERIAVGCICRNRLANFRSYRATQQTYKAICLARNQFSCWNRGSGANHSRLIQQMEALVTGKTIDPILKETLFLAQGIINGTLLDRTFGANFYYAPKSMVPPGGKPAWAANRAPIADIGDQLFFKI